MKTLEQIKEEYAIVYCQYPSWEDFINDIPSCEVESHMDEVAKIYAEEYARKALMLASENFKMKLRENYMYLHMNDEWREVDKQSILSENNLPKHR